MIGDEEAVARQIAAIAEAGATDFVADEAAAVSGTPADAARTRAFLKSLLA